MHAAYDADYAQRFWRVLLQADRVFKSFRTRFIGKCSPVHFFWGSFDLAVTRFSGRRAPRHPGGFQTFVVCEAYSHEVSSAGFWPGGGIDYPAFYSYAYPMPEGFTVLLLQLDPVWADQDKTSLFFDDRENADAEELAFVVVPLQFKAAVWGNAPRVIGTDSTSHPARVQG